MNTHSGRSSAPKKARWTTAKKVEAKQGPKKPHRGQPARTYDDRAPQGPARPTTRDTNTTDGRAPRREWKRDDRAPRRDDRSPRSDWNRDNRAPRRDDRAGSDRAPRSDWNRDNRAPRRDDRAGSDRAPRSDWNRDNRAPRRDDRAGSDRAPRSDAPRSDWNRDNRTPRSDWNRDDRAGSDRAPRSDWNRDNRAPRRDDRAGSDRAPRSDAPRSDWNRDNRAPRRDDRPAYDRPRREDRAPRTDWNRDDRAPRRDDRPAYDRPRRDDRAPRTDWNREDRAPRRERPAEVEMPVTIGDDNGFASLGLPSELVGRLARDGITAPFPIQLATIPDALAGRDVLGRGQTGSGKTLAFGLPTLARLAQAKAPAVARRPKALILVPTRELAMQVSDALEPLVHVMGLRHKLVAGGLSYTPQITALNRGVELLIATPGRLNDLIERGAVELGDVEIAILDEADHMADMGFMPEVTAILDLIPAGGQRLLFSATLDNGIDTLVERYLSDPVTHSTDDAQASVTTMEHHVLHIEPMHKKVITAEVANREGRTVVFVRTKLGADRVAEQLREQGVFAAALHGGLNQGARNRVLAAFRDGSLPVLVATDVAARGIHVDDVSVVLQVDPPADHKDYLHRSGRTARAGDRGTVVTLALPHQRRGVERLTREAGVEVTPTRAIPGDAALLEATGARTPSGVPVPEHQVRRLLDGEQRQHRRPQRGAPREGGHRGPRAYRGARQSG